MKLNNSKSKKTNAVNRDNLDLEMANYSESKHYTAEDISEFEYIRHLIRDKMSQSYTGFNPFFVELLISRLNNKKLLYETIDISFDLSFLLKRVMVAAVFTLVFLLSYLYITHGSLSEMFVLNSENLNDAKLIFTILNDF